MSTKGKSNLYGYGKRGQATEKINFKYAKYFSSNKREDHVKRHGNKEMGLTTNQYLSKALAFANKVDYENHDSFVIQSGKTFKYSFKTKEFSIISSRGIIETYFRINYKTWEAYKKHEKK